MTAREIGGAVVLGLVLASLPFVRYRFASPHPTAHADHGARRGGAVVMVGDLHVEIVEGAGGMALHVSDAWRRPVEPEAGRVRAGEGAWQTLRPAEGRLVGAAPFGRGIREIEVVADGETTRFRLPPPGDG